jgi:hypothetical protein
MTWTTRLKKATARPSVSSTAPSSSEHIPRMTGMFTKLQLVYQHFVVLPMKQSPSGRAQMVLALHPPDPTGQLAPSISMWTTWSVSTRTTARVLERCGARAGTIRFRVTRIQNWIRGRASIAMVVASISSHMSTANGDGVMALWCEIAFGLVTALDIGVMEHRGGGRRPLLDLCIPIL